MAVNQHVNKVILNGTTLMDVSDTSITDEDMMEGVTATMPDGSVKSGKMRLDDIEDLLSGISTAIEGISGGGSPAGIRLANVSDTSITGVFGTGITINWMDPDDAVTDPSDTGGAATLAEWAGTKLVRKPNSAPLSPTDGVVIVDNKIRGQYATSGYLDDSTETDVTYYYRFFPYTIDGVYTTGSYVSYKINYPSWSTSSDSDVKMAIQMAHNGELDLYEDLGWRVGDSRNITITPYNEDASNGPSLSTSYALVTSMVLANKGSDIRETTTQLTKKDGTKTNEPNFVVLMKCYGNSQTLNGITLHPIFGRYSQTELCNDLAWKQSKPSAGNYRATLVNAFFTKNKKFIPNNVFHKATYNGARYYRHYTYNDALAINSNVYNSTSVHGATNRFEIPDFIDDISVGHILKTPVILGIRDIYYVNSSPSKYYGGVRFVSESNIKYTGSVSNTTGGGTAWNWYAYDNYVNPAPKYSYPTTNELNYKLPASISSLVGGSIVDLSTGSTTASKKIMYDDVNGGETEYESYINTNSTFDLFNNMAEWQIRNYFAPYGNEHNTPLADLFYVDDNFVYYNSTNYAPLISLTNGIKKDSNNYVALTSSSDLSWTPNGTGGLAIAWGAGVGSLPQSSSMPNSKQSVDGYIGEYSNTCHETIVFCI